MSFQETVLIYFLGDFGGKGFLLCAQVFDKGSIFLVTTFTIHLALLVPALEICADVIERSIDAASAVSAEIVNGYSELVNPVEQEQKLLDQASLKEGVGFARGSNREVLTGGGWIGIGVE